MGNGSNYVIMVGLWVLILHVGLSKEFWFACVDYGIHDSDSSCILEECLIYVSFMHQIL